MEYMPLIVFAGVISVLVLVSRATTTRGPRAARRGWNSFDSSSFSAMDTSSPASGTTDHLHHATHGSHSHGSDFGSHHGHSSSDFGSGHHGGDFGGGHCSGHH